MKNIGIFAGTFDPIHEGHVAFARAVLDVLHLDEIIFLPEPSPRAKHGVSAIDTRLKQITDRLKSEKNVRALLLEQKRFSVGHTMPILEKLFPSANFTLLIGSDVSKSLATWPGISRLLTDYTLAIGLRATETEEQIHQAMDVLEDRAGVAPQYTIVTTAHGHESSSKLKNRR